MSIDFKIKDFAYPAEILKLRSFLEKSQWFTRERLEYYQLKRLRLMLSHAYKNVPYYSELFARLKLTPSDFRSIEDLKKVPPLAKKDLKENFHKLVAKNAKRFNPILCRTSGTSGHPIEFYLDKNSNILEFCYYWRCWSWAGYRLGMSFMEFSFHHFLNTSIKEVACHSLLTNRLIINPAQISCESIDKIVGNIKRYKPMFVKGTPSAIYIFSVLLEKKGCMGGLPFKGVFTTGELVLPYQKERIEKVLNCKILDSYGHMERAIAVSQCPQGTYHINSEYGILEVETGEKPSSDKGITGQIIGTSLHNFAMPLIRYKIGDLIELDRRHDNRCVCGRGLPAIKKIYGRTQDVIVTKEGRFITNIFPFFDLWKNILWFQLVQEDIDKFKLMLVKDSGFEDKGIDEQLYTLKSILGKDAKIELRFFKLDEINIEGGNKYRPIVSRVDVAKFI
ncbi:MAG: hypothetical protein A2Z72_05975 [Omnitrophica bacterium RBG_13_46_9]|nr:MAG: hypothetical protein A2Z72_05975 [Omnitrophica bacterium RBG_13_46_9]